MNLWQRGTACGVIRIRAERGNPMLSRCRWLAVVAVVWGMTAWCQQVDAGVKGKSYNIRVQPSSGAEITGICSFAADGSFDVNGDEIAGTFTEFDLVFLSFFRAEGEAAGNTSVNFEGLQIFSFLLARGTIQTSTSTSFQVFGIEVSGN